MSYEKDRGGTTCCSIFVGIMIIFMSAMFYFMTFPPFIDFRDVFLGIIVFGGLIIIYGLTLIPSNNRARARNMSIYKIAAVRKQVSISDICTETGLDYEYVRNYIEESIIYHRLHGYLEDDVFVRDVSHRRRSVSDDDVGLGSIMDN